MKGLSLSSILLCLALFISCGTTDPATSEISGITRTYENGTVVEVDPDDWRVTVASGDPTLWATIAPASPNPATSWCEFNFRVSRPVLLQLYIVNREGEEVRALANDSFATAGDFLVEWDLKDNEGELLAPGLYRAIISLTDANAPDNRITSYGDIEILP